MSNTPDKPTRIATIGAEQPTTGCPCLTCAHAAELTLAGDMPNPHTGLPMNRLTACTVVALPPVAMPHPLDDRRAVPAVTRCSIYTPRHQMPTAPAAKA